MRGRLCVWNRGKGQSAWSTVTHGGPVLCDISSAGASIAVCVGFWPAFCDSQIRIFDLYSGEERLALEFEATVITELVYLRFSEDATCLRVGTTDYLATRDRSTGSVTKALYSHQDLYSAFVGQLDISATGKVVAVIRYTARSNPIHKLSLAFANYLLSNALWAAIEKPMQPLIDNLLKDPLLLLIIEGGSG